MIHQHHRRMDRWTDRQTTCNHNTSLCTIVHRAAKITYQQCSMTKKTRTRKLNYRKDDHAMCPIYECPENFRDSLTMPTATFPRNFYWPFLPTDAMNMQLCIQTLELVALPVPEIIGVPPKLGSPWIRHAPFVAKIFNGLLFGWTLWTFQPNLKFVALPIPQIIGIPQKFGQSLDMPTLPF